MADLGVYIHYPWCRKLCPYCDFAVAVARSRPIPHAEYLAAVLAELRLRVPEFSGRDLRSIYFGGGTPSLWPVDCLAAVVAAVREAFPASAPLEITLEANPADCTPDALVAWRAAGINRVSVGVQSLDPGELALLGRDHGQGDGRAALVAVAAAGLDSWSADVIIGIPLPPGDPERRARGASPESKGDAHEPAVAAVADLGPPHLSVYELTIEARTRFGHRVRRGDLQPHAEELLADKLAWVHRELHGRGYDHYEVSSYARPGYRAVHNSLYWRGAEFLGLGCGAASFRRDPVGDRAWRWTNLRAAGRYLRAAAGAREAERIELGRVELEEDGLWLALRTTDGVTDAALAARPDLRASLLRDRLAVADGGRIRPTLRGFLHADEVARRVVRGHG